MYVIGIDVSEYKHDCIILKENTGEIVRDIFSIENSRSGFNQLSQVLKTLDTKIKKESNMQDITRTILRFC